MSGLKWIVRLLALLIILGTIFVLRPVQLEVPYESQLPTLPNGCEAVSLAMVSSYYMAPIDGASLVNNYLAKGPIGTTDPHEAYVGDPYGDGYYAYQAVIARTAQAYFDDCHLPLKAKAPVVTDPWRLAFHLQRGEPSLVWITVDDKNPRRDPNATWQLGDKSYSPYTNLHVAVLDGINWRSVHLSDPQNGAREMPLWLFLKNYILMGMRAVIVTH